MCIVRHVKYPLLLSDFNETRISRQIFEKSSNRKFNENPYSGSRMVPCERTERRAYMTKVIVAFPNFTNTPKNRIPVLNCLTPHTTTHSPHGITQICLCWRDSAVGIATRYGLDGPGIVSRRGEIFPNASRPSLGPSQHPVLWVPGLFPRGKAAGALRWPPTPHLAPRLRRSSCTPPLSLHGLF